MLMGQCSARYEPTTGNKNKIYTMYNSLAGFHRILLLIVIEDVQNIVFSCRS